MTSDTGQARCTYCGSPLTGVNFSAQVQYCCFGCQLAHAVIREAADPESSHRTLTRLGFAIFFSMNVMLFSMVLWSSDWEGVAHHEKTAIIFFDLLRWLCLALTGPVMVLLGIPIVQGSWSRARVGRFGADTLIVLGASAAYVHSTWNVLRGEGHVYFEVAAMVMVAFTLGKWLEAHGRMQASRLIESLMRLIPEHVVRLGAEGDESVAIQDVRVGDLIRVRPGERLVVDGHVVRGYAHLDQRLLTGEIRPRTVGPGDRVLGGTLNLDGDLVVSVTEPPQSWSLYRLVDSVRNAVQHKGFYQRLVDRVSRVFTPVVLGVALASGIFWSQSESLERGLQVSLSVLLIACPCALGLATPMALSVAMATAARYGICFRHGDSLARLATVRLIAFDKTGTLTDGIARVVFVKLAPGVDLEQVRYWTALATSTTNHPIAEALRTWAGPANESSHLLASAQTFAGSGVVIRLHTWPTALWLGRLSWLVNHGLELPEPLEGVSQQAMEQGHSVTAIGWNGRVQAVFVCDECLRPEASTALRQLKRLGCRVALLTGDHPARGKYVATLLEIDDVHAGLLPEQKVEHLVHLYRRCGNVGMVGDGINDVPSLAAAQVGIAMGSGLELARQSADVCLLSNDLRSLAWAIELSRKTCRTIRGNLWWAFSYNSFGIALAAAGYLHPVLAALAMLLSSSMVIGRSLHLGRTTGATHDANARCQVDPEQVAQHQTLGRPAGVGV